VQGIAKIADSPDFRFAFRRFLEHTFGIVPAIDF
jgi:hypothetical protein